jgi:hypothetical protein
LKLQQLESQVLGSCGGRPEVPKAGTGGARQATTLFKVRTVERGIFDRLMFKMHYSKLLVKIRPSCFLKSWMQCLSKIFSSKAASAAVGYRYCYCYWFLYGCCFVVVIYRYKFNLY